MAGFSATDRPPAPPALSFAAADSTCFGSVLPQRGAAFGQSMASCPSLIGAAVFLPVNAFVFVTHQRRDWYMVSDTGLTFPVIDEHVRGLAAVDAARQSIRFAIETRSGVSCVTPLPKRLFSAHVPFLVTLVFGPSVLVLFTVNRVEYLSCRAPFEA